MAKRISKRITDHVFLRHGFVKLVCSGIEPLEIWQNEDYTWGNYRAIAYEPIEKTLRVSYGFDRKFPVKFETLAEFAEFVAAHECQDETKRLKLKGNVDILFVKAKEKRFGIPMNCISKKCSGAEFGAWTWCYDPSWFNIVRKYWQPYEIKICHKGMVVASTDPTVTDNILTADTVKAIVRLKRDCKENDFMLKASDIQYQNKVKEIIR